MENIPEYAENKRKNQVLIKDANKKILSGVDELVPILSDTFGIIVYQEQIIQIANIWAGYTYGQADLLRRAISKKKLDVLQAEGARFLKKSLEKNRDEQTTKRIYELIVKFANYGFNRAHSTIYSYFAYQMAYLKAHFPMEFMASQLTVLTNGKKKQVEQAAIYFEEAKRMGIKMYGPNVNDSYQEFVVKEDGIHFGLTMIKNVGRTAAKDIVEVREKYGRFTSFQDFLSKTEGTEVDKNAKEALVKVGAFSQFGNRKQLLEQLSTKKVNKAAETQFKFSEILGIEPDWKVSLPEVEDFSLNQKLQFEDELLCMFIENPLIHYKDSVKKIWEKEKRQNRKPGKWVAGVVQKIKTKNDSMGREMAFLKIIGPKTSYELIVFSSLWVSLKNLIVPYGIYLFKGDETDRANRIIVTDSFPLPREKELSVMIPNEMESYAQEDRNMWLKGMLEIIKNHPGNTSVVLNHGQNKKQLSEKYDVAVSNDLKKELTEYIKDEKKIVIQYYECQ
jgi:DNA polymerase-3 subunit alpha